jgi:hypothetical protein
MLYLLPRLLDYASVKMKQALFLSALLLSAPFTPAQTTNSGGLEPLRLVLPSPAFKGTPKNVPVGPFTEPLSDKPRPPFMVPSGLRNLAPGAKLSCSDRNATREQLAKLTDGDKDASDSSVLLLRKGTQYIQLDLGKPFELFAVVLWHSHTAAKVYHGVIVQLADDADFTQNVRTLFNNDHDNALGLGVGSDREYFETHEGRLIDAKGAKARFVRCYSRGSTESPLNEYTEIEIYGR